MNEEKMIIASLAMDLKRVALGLHRGSVNMANRFKQEALQRMEELASTHRDDYLDTLLVKTKAALTRNDERVAEDALMYSTLFQNFSQKKMRRLSK